MAWCPKPIIEEMSPDKSELSWDRSTISHKALIQRQAQSTSTESLTEHYPNSRRMAMAFVTNYIKIICSALNLTSAPLNGHVGKDTTFALLFTSEYILLCYSLSQSELALW